MNKRIISMICILMMLLGFSLTASADQKEIYLYDAECEKYGEIYGICPEILEAMIFVESSGKMDSKNGSCYGIMQINGDVWGYGYDDPEKQIKKACELLISYDCEIDEALSKYNGQSSYRYEGYVEKVLDYSAELERAHGK